MYSFISENLNKKPAKRTLARYLKRGWSFLNEFHFLTNLFISSLRDTKI